MNVHRIRTALLAGGDLAVLVAVHPDWHGVLAGLAAPRTWLAAGPDAAVAEACAAVLWLAAAWIGIGLLAGLGARLPGAVGRRCARCARLVVPRVLLRVVLGSAGLGLLAAPAAHAATPASTWVRPVAVASTAIGAGVPSPGWPVGSLPAPAPPTTSTPTSTPAPPAPPTSTPTVPAPAPAPAPAPTPAPTSGGRARPATARVQVGDSLWLLAARRLGPHAGADDIAQYWPQIYAANRGVLGDDPSVIHAGQVLHLPAPTRQESP